MLYASGTTLLAATVLLPLAMGASVREDARLQHAGTAAVATNAAGPADTLRFVLAETGNEARYRVREQLARIDFPSDAIGVTSAITGGIVFTGDGSIVRDASKFVVDLTTLKSDSDRRDGFIQRRTLNTAEFPNAEFVPTHVDGLPSPLPGTGTLSFEMVGDLTVHGVTRPVTWSVSGQASDQGYSGSATTAFTFADFGMEAPRVAVLLSVEDTIRLEYDFHLIPAR